MKVFACNTPASTRTVALSSDQYPTCSHGQGMWVEVSEIQPASPWTRPVSEQDMTALLSATAWVLVVAVAVRAVLSVNRKEF